MYSLVLVPGEKDKWMQKKKYLSLSSDLEKLGYKPDEPYLSITENVHIQAFFKPPLTAVIYHHWMLGYRAEVYFATLDDREFTFTTTPPIDESEVRPSKSIEFFDHKKTSTQELHDLAMNAVNKETSEIYELNSNNFTDVVESSYFRDKVWQNQKVDNGPLMNELGDDDDDDVEVINIEEIIAQAERVLSSNTLETTTIYLLEKKAMPPDSNCINRVAGKAIGIPDRKWPKCEGERMEHAITIDLRLIPKVGHSFPDGVVAVSLFVNDLMDNPSYEPMSKEVKVITLKQEDLDSGVNQWEPVKDDDFMIVDACSFDVHEIEVPVDIFNEEIYEREESDPILKLSEDIGSCSFAGGKPIWIQGAQYDKNIIMQFDESLVDMNLGDGGCMYVFEDTAFWQCH